MTPSSTRRIGAIMRAVADKDAARREARRNAPVYGKRFRPDYAEATVTLCNRETGALRTTCGIVRGGTLDALRAALAGFTPDAWYVVCISTPQSILSDLKRRSAAGGLYERAVLGQAGLSAFVATR